MDLREYLEEHHKITDYIPPYGTQLTVRDFSPVVFDSGQHGLTVEAYSSGGKRSTYELEVLEHYRDGHAMAVCRRDGVSVDYVHPWSTATTAPRACCRPGMTGCSPRMPSVGHVRSIRGARGRARQ